MGSHMLSMINLPFLQKRMGSVKLTWRFFSESLHHGRHDWQMLPLWARSPLMERPRVSDVQPKSLFKLARGICRVQKDRTGPQHVITQHPEVQQQEQRLTKRVKPSQHRIDLAKNDDQPQTPSVQWAGTFGKREAGIQSTQAPPVKLKRKQNAIPPRRLNADPLAQFIGMNTIAEALIDNVPTKVLLDMGTTIDLMPISYDKAAGLEIKPFSDYTQACYHESCCRVIFRGCRIHRVQSEGAWGLCL